MSQKQIDELMKNTKTPLMLREETFYYKFPIDILEDSALFLIFLVFNIFYAKLKL